MLPPSIEVACDLFRSFLPSFEEGLAIRFFLTGSFRFGAEPQKAKDLDFIVEGVPPNRLKQWNGLSPWDCSEAYNNGFKATVLGGPGKGLIVNVILMDDSDEFQRWMDAGCALEAIPAHLRPAGKDARAKMHEALLADYLEQRNGL